MIIYLKVKPNSKFENVEKINDKNFVVHIKKPPIENKANKELIKILTKFFGIPKSQINIIKGLKSKNKIIEVKGFIPAL